MHAAMVTLDTATCTLCSTLAESQPEAERPRQDAERQRWVMAGVGTMTQAVPLSPSYCCVHSFLCVFLYPLGVDLLAWNLHVCVLQWPREQAKDTWLTWQGRHPTVATPTQAQVCVRACLVVSLYVRVSARPRTLWARARVYTCESSTCTRGEPPAMCACRAQHCTAYAWAVQQ